MRTLLLACLLSLIPTIGVADSCPPGGKVRPYVIEFYSIASLPRAHDTLAPLVRELATRSKLCMSLRVFDTVSAFHDRFTAGEPDFAVTNPYLLANTRARTGYVTLLMDSKVRLQGALVVRRESRYRSLEDLRDVEIGVPAFNTFIASLLIRDELNRAGVPHRLVELGTHANVLRGVVRGRVEAGGVVQKALDVESPELTGSLRVLLRTPEQPSPPLVAHPRVPEADRQALVRAVMELSQEAEWRSALSDVWLADPVKAVYDRDYKHLERLKLQVEPTQAVR